MEKNFFREQQDCSEFWQQINRLLEKEYIIRPLEGFNLVSELRRTPTPPGTNPQLGGEGDLGGTTRTTRQYFRWPHTFTTIRKLKCTVCETEKEDRLEEYQMLRWVLIQQSHCGGVSAFGG